MHRGHTQVTVGFETLTDESVEQGDFEDIGWIHPATEAQRSLRKGGKRIYERNVRMAQRGAFDWELRDALEWLDSNNPGYLEGYVDSGRVLTRGETAEGQVKLVWALTLRAIADGHDIVMTSNGYGYAPERINYEVHVRTLSHGSRARLRRLLEARGVRFCEMG